MPSSWVRAPTAASKTCARSQSIIEGHKKADGVRVMVVPGSARVRIEAEAEGIDKIVEEFGAEWRFAGCSMCLGMNPDQLAPGERCASTSNRNFEGRQGKGGRTHLVSPLVAAATAIRGTLSSPWDLDRTSSDSRSLDPRARPRKAGVADGQDHHRHRHRGSAAAQPTSTPTRSSRPCFSSGSPRPASTTPCSSLGDRIPSSCSTANRSPAPGQGRTHPRRRARLRHRLQPRARRLGAARLRLPGGAELAFRRHLPWQLGQAGSPRGPTRRERHRRHLGDRRRDNPESSCRSTSSPAP